MSNPSRPSTLHEPAGAAGSVTTVHASTVPRSLDVPVVDPPAVLVLVSATVVEPLELAPVVDVDPSAGASAVDPPHPPKNNPHTHARRSPITATGYPT